MTLARCREHDPEVFFVRGAAQSRRAIKICANCDVRDECLQYSIENDVEFGIWGGMTERQRRRLTRAQATA